VATLYVTGSDGILQRAKAVRCKDEERELQDLLQRNPALLVGEQINPDEPRRWLLIKREMSVPDPTTGSGRWAVDFLYVDQDATLTFVECKRHGDTRSRREVIAQVIDYVANSSRLWNREQLVAAASAQAKVDNTTLDLAIRQLGASDFPDANSLMQAAIAKLSQHDVRIILFMEEAPPELKTIVEFMNKEMTSVEILLIEARMYEVNGAVAVSPTLWGFTEEVRERKQAMAEAAGDRVKWDESRFLADLRQRVAGRSPYQAVLRLYNELPGAGYAFRFGTGSVTGTVNARLPGLSQLALITVRSDGNLTVNFGSFANSEGSALREKIANIIRKAGLAVPDDYSKRYVNYRLTDWAPTVDALVNGLATLASTELH
jgi:hypothetical protein